MVRALFPGTFDPIHFGHIDIAERASRLFDEVVMAVYDKPLKSLMFTPEERIGLVKEAFKDNPKIKVTGYSGLTVEFARKIEAQVIVRGLRVFSDFEFEFRMASITDVKLIEKARAQAQAVFEKDADLSQPEHKLLAESLGRFWGEGKGDVS